MPAVGEVWSHRDFYVDPAMKAKLTKYLLMAMRPDGDVVYRLLSSREYNRGTKPACVHSGDRPGYYLGVPQPAGPLMSSTWLDSREVENDFDSADFARLAKAGVLRHIHTVPSAILCPALACAAYAQDTTKSQKNHIMQSRANLGCP